MIDQLIEISRIVGMRNDYVQAGGGNTSVKIDNSIMAIKSSGYLLSDMKLNEGYSIVDFSCIKQMIKKEKYTEKEILDKCHISGNKASIEVFLHSMTRKYTVHIHSLLSNILLARNNCEEIVNELFPNSAFIDYTTPGLELAYNMIKKYNEEEIIFLKNHGLIVTSDNYEEIEKLIDLVDLKLSKYLNIKFEKYDNVTKIYKLIKKYDNDLVYLSEDIDIYKAFNKNNNKLWNYKFCPDCVVYCGLKELNLECFLEKELDEFVSKNGKIVLIVYKNYIYICAKTLKKAREIESLLSFSAKIFLNNEENNLNYLTNEEAKKLYNCDFEKYRQNID